MICIRLGQFIDRIKFPDTGDEVNIRQRHYNIKPIDTTLVIVVVVVVVVKKATFAEICSWLTTVLLLLMLLLRLPL